MHTSPPPDADNVGLTGPHPNPISDLQLAKPSGTTVSLHRYAGRWVIVRVTEAVPSSPPMGSLPEVDFVPVSVVSGPIPADASEECSVVYDIGRVFARRFPAIALPATYVIDPDGRLVAILDDHGWPGFLENLIRQSERPTAHGAIELRDISA